MAISATCACGKTYSGKDEWAGKTMACPACQGQIVMPAAAKPAVADEGPSGTRVTPATRVSIVDIDVSWFNLAAFLVKLVAASFPAAVVAYLLYGSVYAILTRR